MEEESKGIATPSAQGESGGVQMEEEDAEEPAATPAGETAVAGRGAPTPNEEVEVEPESTEVKSAPIPGPAQGLLN